MTPQSPLALAQPVAPQAEAFDDTHRIDFSNRSAAIRPAENQDSTTSHLTPRVPLAVPVSSLRTDSFRRWGQLSIGKDMLAQVLALESASFPSATPPIQTSLAVILNTLLKLPLHDPNHIPHAVNVA